MPSISSPRDAVQAAGRLCQLGRVAEAVELCTKAIIHFPFDSALLGTLGLCYFSLRQAVLAADAFKRALKLSPNVAHLHYNLGLALEMQDLWLDAMPAYRRATELAPKDEPPYLKLAELLMAQGKAEEAENLLAIGLANIPNSFRIWLLMAKARVENRNSAGVEEAYRKAMEISPAAANAYGFWLQVEGRLDEASEIFERSLAANPKQGMTYYALLDRKLDSAALAIRISQMEPLVNDSALSDSDSLYLFYALGKAYEQVRRYESAMECFDRANTLAYHLHNEGRPFDQSQLREINDVTMAAFDNSIERPGCSSSCRPIFVVGMIRSGTTLVEQILGCHPDVAAAGELRFWVHEPHVRYPYDQLDRAGIEDIAGRYLEELNKANASEPFVIDKMPLNYTILGFIHTVFPQAKIVHVRRNPVDTCLSIYSNYFGAGPSFPYRKENIVFNYREYLRLMDHWRKVIPASKLIEVDYEDLVSSPEFSIRQIVESCGLEWSEACLRHYESRNAVNTPSRLQVRQPMYTTSTEKWRRYGPWLGVFADLLRPDERELL